MVVRCHNGREFLGETGRSITGRGGGVVTDHTLAQMIRQRLGECSPAERKVPGRYWPSIRSRVSTRGAGCREGWGEPRR